MHFPEDFFRWLVIFFVRAQQHKKPLFVGTLFDREKIGKALTRIALAVALSTMPVSLSFAQQPREQSFNIPQQSVQTALTSLANQANVYLLFPYDQVIAVNANAVQGTYSVQQALNILLHNTGLSGDLTEGGVLAISRAGAHASATENHGKGKSMNTTNSSKRKTVLAGLVGLFAATGGVGSALAQGGEAATGQSAIDEIIVTANKREQRLSEVPMSISALNGEDMVKQGITDLQSLSLAVAGLNVLDSGSNQRRLVIRGIGNTFGSSSLVGVYIDEVAVTAWPDRQLDLRTHDLDRVEVLKGPQGTLYGEGSVGGAIRFITKDPQLDGFSGSILVDGSSTKDGDTSQEFKTVLNMPMSETAGLRVVAQYINSGGWIDQPTLNKEDINDYELFNVRSKFLWQPSDNLVLKAAAVIHRNDAGAQNNVNDGDNYIQSLSDPSTPSAEDDYDFFSLTVEYDMEGVSLVSATGYLDSNGRLRNVADQCCYSPTGDPDELEHSLWRDWKKSGEVFTQELRFSSDNESHWHWTTGLFYKDASFIPIDSGAFMFGTFGPVITFAGDSFYSRRESQSWAIFGETGYKVSDQLEVGAGIRYFEDDREFFEAADASVGNSASFDSTNPKFYISYYVNEDVHLYANAAKGFRSGGFNFGVTEPTFEPESVWSYELGSKVSSLDGRLSTEFAIFHSQYDDYQIATFDPVLGYSITANAGDADIEGVEFSLRFLASDQLDLGVNGSYIDTEVTTAGGVTHAVGDPIDLIPRHSYSLWANYSFGWSNNAAGFFRVDYSQQGKSYYRNRSFDDPFIGLVYQDNSDVIDMLNARLGWERDAISLEFYGLNLLDEDGSLTPFGIEWASNQPRPRTFGINLGYQF